MKGHYNPTPSPIVQRFKFNSRMRQQSENVATFVTALKQLTEHCVFGAALDDMLRDRLVCGIGDGKIQRRLLAESELTFKKAFELAQAMETADRDARDLGKPREEVHAIGGRPVVGRTWHPRPLTPPLVIIAARGTAVSVDSRMLCVTDVEKEATSEERAAAEGSPNSLSNLANGASPIQPMFWWGRDRGSYSQR